MAAKTDCCSVPTPWPRVSLLRLAFRLGLVVVTSSGCAGARDEAVSGASGPEVGGSETASGGAPAVANTTPTAASSFEQRMAEAEERAMAHLEAGDVASAEQALRPLLAEAAAQDDAGSPLHVTLAWLAWVKGDYETALAENRQASEAHGNSRLVGHMSAYYRVSLLWQRAFLLIGQAAHTGARARTDARARARQAIDDCRVAAESLGLGEEADLLTWLFTQRFGGNAPNQCSTNLTEADDPALLYVVIDLCRGRGGGTAAQQALRALQHARQAVPSVDRVLFLQRVQLGH